jgi:hypothetical protein
MGWSLRKTRIVLEDVVTGQVIQREPSRVGLGVGADGEVEQEGRDVGVEVDRLEEAIGEILLGDVLARAREKAVVCKGVEEWAWAPDCLAVSP